MKSTLTPKAHKKKFAIAQSQQKGLVDKNLFVKKQETNSLKNAREKFQQASKK